MKEKDIDAAVGMTRKWDAREAGRDVARNTIKNLKTPPSFIVLFSTIHYKDHGGFEEFLKGVWDVIPEGTPLVGGTVAGFMNNYGCYARGASALAVSYSNMNIGLGVGKNTKRSPKKASRQAVNLLKNELDDSNFESNFIFNFISGPEVPNIPGLGRKKIIKSGIISKFAPQAFKISQSLFQKGFAMEDKIFKEITKKLPNFNMVLGTSTDDYKALCNYQFHNDKLLDNSVISLGISTDIFHDVFTTHVMEKSEDISITKIDKSRHIVKEINNKPAVPELLKILNWPSDFLNEKTMSHTILYYPLCIERHNHKIPAEIVFILKDSFLVPCSIDSDTISIIRVSGEDIINTFKENLIHYDSISPEFGLFSVCVTIIESIGYKMNLIKNEISNYFGEKPFLMFFCTGEGTYSPKEKIKYANMSVNSAIFGNPK